MLNIYTACMKTSPLDLRGNLEKAEQQIEKALEQKADMIVFPKGFLSGVQLGVLEDALYFRKFYNQCSEILGQKFAEKQICILADKLTRSGFEPVFYLKGEENNSGIQQLQEIKVAVYNEIQLFFKACYTFADDSDMVVLCDSAPVLAGQRQIMFENLQTIATNMNVPCILNIGGWGYTSHPDVYMPCKGVFSKQQTSISKTLQEYKQMPNLFAVQKPQTANIYVNFVLKSLSFDIAFHQNPLIPKGVDEKEYCLDLFQLQAVALATRLDNIGCKKAVVAVSGGLDSALAFLVTIQAFALLGLDRKGIIPISMPGFGTSSTTKSLAQQLIEAAGFAFQSIDITKAAYQALLDIGHDGKTPDVTFENVQARMRTLHALNIANAQGAIMIGTGDLSEEALGFSTYGGDHLASYNVNSSVSKTVIRTMLPYIVQMAEFSNVKQAIQQILSIPVSPELVPHGGEILQKTEEILAPYKLIDFFIYCFLIPKMSPIEMAQRASCVFEGEFSNSYLKEKAELFCRRFVSGQFKRSCAPEGAKLTHVHLNTQDRSLPSDASVDVFQYYLGK